ncbi:NIPSNAP family protein [Flindersiella endophytica]
MNDTIGCPVVELRQYTLRPGRRDELIELFDREFVESQEELGMAVLGQFRDLDRPDRFVWLRGFGSMAARPGPLDAFYTGPVWRTHGKAANATMLDSDDVLLLRPLPSQRGFPVLPERPPAGATELPASRLLVTIHYGDAPFDAPMAAEVEPQAWFVTEYAENNFPALPVRQGEHVLVSFTRFESESGLDDHLSRVKPSERSEQLRLAPTARSRFR